MGIKITKKEIIHTSKYLEVIAASFIGTNGKEGVWEYVNKKSGIIAILAFTEDDRAVIVRQFRIPVESYILQLPMGLIDEKDENPTAAAKRELLEETGYDVDKIIPLGIFPGSPSISNAQIHVFGGQGAKKITEPRHENAEDIEVLLVSKEELLSYIGKEPITERLFSTWLLMENHLKSQ